MHFHSGQTPQCRCFHVPVLEGDEEATTSGPNYEDWFNRQKPDVQLDILGPSRFKAFQDGRAVTAFVDGDHIMTLDELGIDRKTRADLREEEATGEEITNLQGNNYQNTLTDNQKEDYKNYLVNQLKDNDKFIDSLA
ncbi:MAG: hypothetical protein FWG35_08745, partial [Spirochaetaceae bacterium]|nr:hypothetical protein [Spirochaetaceae bacterium]